MARKPHPEPFRIKMVEPIRLLPRQEREAVLQRAGYNVFNIRSEDVFIDLLTDSGTSAMSASQWAALMVGDEAYAGSASFHRLREAVEEIFGYPYVIPTHQGRAAENVLFGVLVRPGTWVAGNTIFDTTRAHILDKGGRPAEFVIAEGLEPQAEHPFKGNVDVARLRASIGEIGAGNVSFVLVTLTSNNNGGQPVSLENLRAVREVASEYGLPLIIDAARYAENALFIKQREAGYATRELLDITREMFALADGCTMSGKKAALVNIGGFIAVLDERLYRACLERLVLFEGFPTYGGLAGRDLEAMAQGLREGLDEAYLMSRLEQVAYLAEALDGVGVPVVKPPGGHGVYVDAGAFLDHLPRDRFPAEALAAALYLEGGIRGAGLGTLALGETEPEDNDAPGAPEAARWRHPPLELLRLAIPRRVYTYAHMDYVADTMARLAANRRCIPGLRLVHEASVLRHFLSTLEPVG
ncbi:MAG: tryptophanase [Bacillota bacterium]